MPRVCGENNYEHCNNSATKVDRDCTNTIPIGFRGIILPKTEIVHYIYLYKTTVLEENMKTRITLTLLLVFAMLVLTLPGCSSQPSSAPPTGNELSEETRQPDTNTLTITDDANREVTLTLPIERVALIDTGAGTALAALGKLNTVVGTHEALQNSLFGELAGVPAVASYYETNYEAIAETQPQAALCSNTVHGNVSVSEQLDGFGIQSIALDLRTPSRMREDYRLLGKVFQSEAEAQRVIDFYDKYENLIAERVKNIPESQRPTVFFEMHSGAFNTGLPGSPFYEQVELAGGRNIAAGVDNTLAGSTEVSAEWLAEQNPDYILCESTMLGYTTASDADAKAFYDSLIARPGLENAAAVKEGNILMISIDISSRPAYIVGVCHLAKELYPELFADLDPAKVLQEWFDLTYSGAKVQGIWAYAE
jgi:iron complex transport system substrate-binding protein